MLQISFFLLAKLKLLKIFDGKSAKPIMHVIYLTLTVQNYSKLLISMLVTLLDQHLIILDKSWMQKHSVILDMSCNKLTFWPSHCQYLMVKNLLGTHTAKLYTTELYALTLKLDKLMRRSSKLSAMQSIKSINLKYIVPAK